MPALSLNTPYGCGHLAVRPEVGQQRELVALRLRPGLERERVVHRDREDLDVVVLEVGEVVADRVQLAGADAGERERVEHEQHGLLAAERRERDVLVVLVLDGEVRGLGTHLGCHVVLHCSTTPTSLAGGSAHGAEAGDADHEEGGVVVQRRPEPVEETAHRRDGLRRARRCLRREELQQVVLVEAGVAVDPGLAETVGVEQEGVAGAEMQGPGDEGGLGQQADDLAADVVAVLRGAVGADHDGRRMPAGGEDDAAAAGSGGEHTEDHAAEPVRRVEPFPVERRCRAGSAPTGSGSGTAAARSV